MFDDHTLSIAYLPTQNVDMYARIHLNNIFHHDDNFDPLHIPLHRSHQKHHLEQLDMNHRDFL